MKEARVGAPLTEFPGGSFNEMQRRIKQLEAQRLPRRRGGRGGGGGGGDSAICLAIADEDIPPAEGEGAERVPETGTVNPLLGLLGSNTWKNYTLTAIPEGSFVVGATISGEHVIIGAWC